MNRIVRGNPVADLPEDLWRDIPANADVRVIIEVAMSLKEDVLSLEELFARRHPPLRPVDEIRRERDAWDD